MISVEDLIDARIATRSSLHLLATISLDNTVNTQ